MFVSFVVSARDKAPTLSFPVTFEVACPIVGLSPNSQHHNFKIRIAATLAMRHTLFAHLLFLVAISSLKEQLECDAI